MHDSWQASLSKTSLLHRTTAQLFSAVVLGFTPLNGLFFHRGLFLCIFPTIFFEKEDQCGVVITMLCPSIS